MVKSFDEWKTAILDELKVLRDHYSYLNYDGKERKAVFALFVDLLTFCEEQNPALELLKWIDTKEGFSNRDLELITSSHARGPIAALRRIVENAEQSEATAEPTIEKKPTYYVTYRIDARYVAEVRANNVEEAKVEARSKWESANFGEAQDIDGEAIIIENENGDFVWER